MSVRLPLQQILAKKLEVRPIVATDDAAALARARGTAPCQNWNPKSDHALRRLSLFFLNLAHPFRFWLSLQFSSAGISVYNFPPVLERAGLLTNQNHVRCFHSP